MDNSEIKKSFTVLINAVNKAQQKGAYTLTEAHEIFLSLQTVNKFVLQQLQANKLDQESKKITI